MALRSILGASRSCQTIPYLDQVSLRFSCLLVSGTSSIRNGPHVTIPQRSIGFFNSISADELWRGVTSVSNAGRKRGRAKRVGMKRATDLNRGQVLGKGKANMQWPGLTARVMVSGTLVKREKVAPDPDEEARMHQLRDAMSKRPKRKLPPLLRGWSGARFPGQSLGTPDPVGDYTFDGFESKVLEFKHVANMTGTLGKKIRYSAFVVTGNKNGLVGYGLGKSQMGNAALRVAKNRAAQNLVQIQRFEDHTVFHNMFARYHKTNMFIHKREKGYGLTCHRALRTICELAGITNLHAKVEGNTKNIQALTKGFIEALVNQETHEELAERTGYHVIELRSERDHFPVTVASPSYPAKDEELKNEEEDIEMDFDRLYYGGKIEYKRPPQLPFYHHLRSFKQKQAAVHKLRNQPKAKLLRDAGLV